MYEPPTLETPSTNFLLEADFPDFPPIFAAGGQENHLQAYTVTPSEGSGTECSVPPHVGGPLAVTTGEE